MRISDARTTSSLERRGKARKSTMSSAFSIEPATPSRSATAAAPAQTIQGIDALLSVQSVEDPLIGRRRALDYGGDILDILEALKLDVVSGRISEGRLKALRSAVAKRPTSDNAELDRLLADIELRAKVELAKRGVFES